MGVEIAVPLGLFTAMVLIFWVIFSYGARRRTMELDAIRSIVDKTGEATPELIRAIGKPNQPKNADLRRGLLLIAVAVAFYGFGVLIGGASGDEEAGAAMLGIALFPGLVGIVYVLFHFLGGRNND